MAGKIATLSHGNDIALTSNVASTVMQLTVPTNERVKILAWGAYFDGVSSSAEPVQVKLLRQSGDGTFTGGITAQKQDNSIPEVIGASGFYKATVEPTSGSVLKCILIHPQMGYEEQLPYGREFIVGGGGKLGIEVTAPSAVNVRPWMMFEE